MSKILNLQLINKSSILGNFCLFAKPKAMQGGKAVSVFPVAFLVAPVAPQESHTFKWSNEKSFVFGQLPAHLEPGKEFVVEGLLKCKDNNHVTLDYNVDEQQYKLKDLCVVDDTKVSSGELCVHAANTIPSASHVNVGLAVNQLPLCVTRVSKSDTNTHFSHDGATYYIAVGNMNEGEIIEPANLPSRAKFEFPKHTDTLFVTFDKDETFVFEKPKHRQ
ncbi:hypothetical protein CYY_000118 [Polysphondylium violaceum]|uniref:Uncharacterized protein n=1 Tax=Polysphondylium violaceum TaxID=133409 RepID=A0A8J4Q0D3_9MYCE|nr:hypothetical protein CYY_000118 [Polysphondylium violaceum]